MDSADKGEIVQLLKHYRKLCKKLQEEERPVCGKILSTYSKVELLSYSKSNYKCADCDAPAPKWASSNLGVFICIKCSGVHRSLGSHISKVMSVVIDQWSETELEEMELKGNKKMNKFYEQDIPANYKKPTSDSTVEERRKYIYSKYVRKRFSRKYIEDHLDAQYDIKSPLSPDLDMTQNPSAKEYIGLLTIHLIGGQHLAARDINGKSDPFVVFALGDQQSKSEIRKSTLQPIWGQTFQFCIASKTEPVFIKVYDYDRAKKNDFLGEGTISIRDLEDGKPTYFCVKLEKIESGEIHLELTYTALS